MKKSTLITIFVLWVIIVCISCIIEETPESSIIEGLTLNNYPIVDGSTSTLPLNAIIACKILGIDYKWVSTNSDGTRSVSPSLEKENTKKFWKVVKSSQTHQSFNDLINKKADLILVARTMSPDEKTAADAAGVALTETPIALDAFVFIVNPDNPIETLTKQQVQDIYTGKITSWKEVGGDDWKYPWYQEIENDHDKIIPYIRNANSGSQELMETLVMRDLDMIQYPEDSSELLFSMSGALDRVSYDFNSICYTVYYYKKRIANGGDTVKSIAIEEIKPEWETISDKSYPYVAPVYAVIRSDLDPSSMAYKLYEWIQTAAGQQVIAESGYVPNN